MVELKISDLEDLMYHYGESLSDLGIIKSSAFVESFKKMDPDSYKRIVEQYGDDFDSEDEIPPEQLCYDIVRNALNMKPGNRPAEILIDYCKNDAESMSRIKELTKIREGGE